MFIAPILAGILAAQGAGPIELTDSNYETWRAYLQPKGSETAWQAIPWRESSSQALADAQASGLPALVWAGIGHPLGCTSFGAIVVRRDVWSDPSVRALVRGFVPCAVDRLRMTGTERGLLAGTDPNSESTIVVVSPEGKQLGWTESPNPTAVGDFLKQHSAAKQTGGRSAVPSARIVDRRLAMRFVARDLPRTPVSDVPEARSVNYDYGWIPIADAVQLVPSILAVGSRAQMSKATFAAWGRLHFVDFVRGLTVSYDPDQVRIAELRSRISQVERDVVALRLSGNFVASATGEWSINGALDRATPTKQARGIDLNLLGRARFDTKQRRFLSFELVAVGKRWGGTAYNRRFGDLASQPIGFLVTQNDPAYWFIPAALGGG